MENPAVSEREATVVRRRNSRSSRAQNGRFVFGDVGLISYTGVDSLDTATLCAALAP
jgi:hypothetical protein